MFDKVLGSLATLRQDLNVLQQDAVTAKDHRDGIQRLAERNRTAVDAAVEKAVVFEENMDTRLGNLRETIRNEQATEVVSLSTKVEARAQEIQVKIEKCNAHAASLERACENIMDRIEAGEQSTTNLSRGVERSIELLQREIKSDSAQHVVSIGKVSDEVLKQVADLRTTTGDAMELVKEQSDSRGNNLDNKLSSLSAELSSFRSNTALVEKETADILARETLAREQQAEISGRQIAQLFATSTQLQDELKSNARASAEQNVLRESIFTEHKTRVADDMEALRSKHNSLDDSVATQIAEIVKSISDTQSDWSRKLHQLEASTSSTAMDNFGKLSSQLRSLEAKHDDDKQHINSVRAELERSSTVAVDSATGVMQDSLKRAEDRFQSNLAHSIEQISRQVQENQKQDKEDRDRLEAAMASEAQRNQQANTDCVTSLTDVHKELSQQLRDQNAALTAFMANTANSNTKLETQLATQDNQAKSQLREIDQALQKIASLKSEISAVDRKHVETIDNHRDQLASAKVDLNAAVRAEAETLNKRLEQLAEAHEQGLERLGRALSDASADTQVKLMDLQRYTK